MTKKKKHGVGIFGMGEIAEEHIAAYMKNPRCEIKAIACKYRENSQEKKDKFNLDCDIMNTYDELIKRDDIDIISMCSPNFLRAEEIVKACDAGKNFFAEKPIAHTIEELKAVKNAYDKAKANYNVKSVTGFVTEYHPQFLCTKSLIEKGCLGKVFFVETDYWHKLGPWWGAWKWRPYTKYGGGSTALLGGCHSIGILMRVGGDVEEVFGYETWGHRNEYEYAPTYASVVKFKNGAIGRTGGSFEIESPYLLNIIIHGSKGSVLNEKFYSKEYFAGQEGYQSFNCQYLDKGHPFSNHPFPQLVNAFIEDIDNDIDSKVRLDFAIKVHEVCLAINRSAETGEKVKLPLI